MWRSTTNHWHPSDRALQTTDGAVRNLISAFSALAAAAEGMEPPPRSLQALRSALQQAQQPSPAQAAQDRFDRDQRLHAQLLPPATQLAAALLDWWRRPEQQQQDALALAHAAAARSCAYLSCANLGGSGGPAAGQGAGSKRCE